MTSMTGYGIHEYQDEQLMLSVEIKSCNNRYLDINLNTPSQLNALEEELRGYIKQHARRGKIDVYVRFRRLQQQVAVRLDGGLLAGYVESFRDACAQLGLPEGSLPAQMSPDTLLQIEGLFTVEAPRSYEDLREPLFASLQTALKQWKASRDREGNTTGNDIREQLERIHAAYAEVAERVPELEERIKRTLQERFTEMMGEQIDLQRVYAETAVLLVKYSVSEELSRLGAHLEEFDRLLQSDGALGKRMDFLCQEMHREMNTIGSKSALLEISRAVINMKDSLENIREQVRNVE